MQTNPSPNSPLSSPFLSNLSPEDSGVALPLAGDESLLENQSLADNAPLNLQVAALAAEQAPMNGPYSGAHPQLLNSIQEAHSATIQGIYQSILQENSTGGAAGNTTNDPTGNTTNNPTGNTTNKPTGNTNTDATDNTTDMPTQTPTAQTQLQPHQHANALDFQDPGPSSSNFSREALPSPTLPGLTPEQLQHLKVQIQLTLQSPLFAQRTPDAQPSTSQSLTHLQAPLSQQHAMPYRPNQVDWRQSKVCVRLIQDKLIENLSYYKPTRLKASFESDLNYLLKFGHGSDAQNVTRTFFNIDTQGNNSPTAGFYPQGGVVFTGQHAKLTMTGFTVSNLAPTGKNKKKLALAIMPAPDATFHLNITDVLHLFYSADNSETPSYCNNNLPNIALFMREDDPQCPREYSTIHNHYFQGKSSLATIIHGYLTGTAAKPHPLYKNLDGI